MSKKNQSLPLLCVIFVLIVIIIYQQETISSNAQKEHSIVTSQAQEHISSKRYENSKVYESKSSSSGCNIRASFSGCCSHNGGMKKDEKGNYVFDEDGFAICNNGTSSKTCNKCR